MDIPMTVTFYQIGCPGSSCTQTIGIVGVLGVAMLHGCSALSVAVFVRA